MSKIKSSIPTPNNDSVELSENLRGLISVALFAHLIVLGLVWFTNNDFAVDRFNLTFLDKTKSAAAYLFPLGMDRAWDHRLTTGSPGDSDHWLEWRATSSDGQTVTQRMPDPAIHWLEYRQRCQILANQIGRSADSPDSSAIDERVKLLAQAWRAQQLAAGIEIERITVECRRRLRIGLNEDTTADPLATTTISPPVYSALIKWPAEQGEPIMAKLGGSARDKAPVILPNETKPAPTN